jgi:hypothetical protein
MKARHTFAQHLDHSNEAAASPKQSVNAADSSSVSSLSRRAFLGNLSGVTVATLTAGLIGVPSLRGTKSAEAEAGEMGPLAPPGRRQQAFQIRQQAAFYQRTLPLLDHRSNEDEDRYPNKIASYTKGLPHNELGEVDLVAYRALMNALASGQSAALEALPLGDQVKLG